MPEMISSAETRTPGLQLMWTSGWASPNDANNFPSVLFPFQFHKEDGNSFVSFPLETERTGVFSSRNSSLQANLGKSELESCFYTYYFLVFDQYITVFGP